MIEYLSYKSHNCKYFPPDMIVRKQALVYIHNHNDVRYNIPCCSNDFDYCTNTVHTWYLLLGSDNKVVALTIP